MTEEEAFAVSEMVAAICPAQKYNEFTPDAWAAILAPFGFDDARSALLRLGQTLRFIAPADIVGEVKRTRAERLKGHVPAAPSDPDDTRGYRDQVRASVSTAASPSPDRVAIAAGPDEVTRRRADQFRVHGQHHHGGCETDTALPARPAPVRDALADARRKCADARTRPKPDVPTRQDPTHTMARDSAGEPAQLTAEDLAAALKGRR